MSHTTTLIIRSQPGLLMQLSLLLPRFGLWVERHKLQPTEVAGVSQLVLTLNGSRPVDEEVRQALLGVEGVIQCPDATGELQPHAPGQVLDEAELQQVLRQAFTDIERAFPNIMMPVRNFAPHVNALQRQRALHALGCQLGRRKYRAEYADGLPLPLGQALVRVVAHAFRPLAPLEIQADTVSFPECRLCDTQAGTLSSCTFFAGLIQGLLTDSPATRGATVSVVSCRAGKQFGKNACVCGIQLAVS